MAALISVGASSFLSGKSLIAKTAWVSHYLQGRVSEVCCLVSCGLSAVSSQVLARLTLEKHIADCCIGRDLSAFLAVSKEVPFECCCLDILRTGFASEWEDCWKWNFILPVSEYHNGLWGRFFFLLHGCRVIKFVMKRQASD